VARKNVIQFSIEVLDKASAKTAAIGQKIKDFTKRVAASATVMAVAFAAAAKSAIGAADQIGKTAKVIGLSAESLQELRFAAEQTGVANIGLDDSMRRMQRRMGEFINSGAGPAAFALKGLNLEITDAAGQFIGTEAAFLKTVKAIQQLNTVAERSAVAAQLFGDDFGPKLIPLLDQGIEGISALRKEARNLGIVLSNETIAKSEEANDAFNRLANVMKTNLIRVFADNAEVLSVIAIRLTEAAIASFKLLDAFAQWVGLVEKGVPQLQSDLADLLGQQQTLIAQFGDAAKTMPVFDTIELRIAEVIEKIKIAQNAVAELVNPPSSGGGSGFSFPDTALQSFIDSLDSDQMKVTKAMAKLRQAIAAGLVPSPEEQERLRQAILKPFLLDEIVVEKVKPAAQKVKEAFNFMKAAAEEAARSMQSALSDFFFDPAEDGLKGLLASFLQVIRRMLAEMLAFQTLKAFKAGPFGALFSGFGTRAGGGPVQAGRPYIVGERGPELFVPSGNGRIANNSAMQGMGSGGPQFITNIDARGADPGLIARLPQILENRDRQLKLAVQRFAETGVMPI
jgi:hypothetical protein